jgi:SAM-dependent methyltransferase
VSDTTDSASPPADATRASEIEARFGASADAYATSAGHRAGTDLDRMVQLAELRGDERVLDIATGAGHTALAFAPGAAFVVAADMARGMLDATRRAATDAGDVVVVLCDAQVLPFAGASFDGVTCRIAPHHFLDPATFVREVARVLRGGGRFLLEDSLGPDPDEVARFQHEAEALRDATHVRSLSRAEWLACLAGAGLEADVVEIHPKRLPFEPWLARAGASEEVKDELRRRFADASPTVRSYLGIEMLGGAVEAFTDRKLLLRAGRRG